jgi:hypothetical protein
MWTLKASSSSGERFSIGSTLSLSLNFSEFFPCPLKKYNYTLNFFFCSFIIISSSNLMAKSLFSSNPNGFMSLFQFIIYVQLLFSQKIPYYFSDS